MNDIDKMPAKCRDCPYWELAVYPWCCGDCKDRLKKPVSDFVSRQWLIDEYHRRHEGPPGGALKMIEEAPAADVEPKRKWISVTERLPEQEGRYLVVHPLHNRFPWVTVMYFGVPDGYDKGICFYIADDDWGDIPCDYVTHWMPLPEPPKEADA